MKVTVLTSSDVSPVAERMRENAAQRSAHSYGRVMKTTPTYHVSLRAHQLAVARLEREHLVRLEAWCAKQSRHERPSLEDFVDEVILDSGCLADGGHSEVDPVSYTHL